MPFTLREALAIEAQTDHLRSLADSCSTAAGAARDLQLQTLFEQLSGRFRSQYDTLAAQLAADRQEGAL